MAFVHRPISPLAFEQATQAGDISPEQTRRLDAIERTLHDPARLPAALYVVGGVLTVGGDIVLHARLACGRSRLRPGGEPRLPGDRHCGCSFVPPAVVSVALFIVAVQRLFGLWPAGDAIEGWYRDASRGWLYVQAGAAVAAAIAVYVVRHAVLSVPLALAGA